MRGEKERGISLKNSKHGTQRKMKKLIGGAQENYTFMF